jgi:hypothetical protein
MSSGRIEPDRNVLPGVILRRIAVETRVGAEQRCCYDVCPDPFMSINEENKSIGADHALFRNGTIVQTQRV